MSFGVCVFSFTIGSITSLLQNADSKETILAYKLSIIDEFNHEAKLDKELKLRLRHALTYSTAQSGFSWAEKSGIFEGLPRNLRYEVA
jgi:hypothetical protein